MANRIGTNRAAHASVAMVIATVMSGLAKADDFKPVTQEVLNNPPAADWLLVAGGFLLWSGIGYLAGALLLRRRSGD